MATAGGPYVKTDTLLFGFDTGRGIAGIDKPTRFYTGRPTDNVITDQGSMSGWDSYSAGNDGTFTTEFGTTGYRIINRASWNGLSKVFVLPSTGTYTFSAYFRYWGGTSANNGARVYISGWGGGDTATSLNKGIKGQWQRVQRTLNVTDTSLRYYLISYGGDRALDRSTWDVTMPQIEKQSTRTPFVNGSRSTTASLLDLKENKSINIANLSFDANQLPIFDGTNDSVAITATGLSMTGFTIELVVKPNSYSNSPLLITPQNAGIDHYVRIVSDGTAYLRTVPAADSGGQTFQTTSSVSTTGYTHLTFTYNSSTGGQAFFNGELEASATPNFTAVSWNTTWYIGQRGNNTFFYNGEIAVLKVYNKVLSAQEVKQNYNVYKNRFGI